MQQNSYFTTLGPACYTNQQLYRIWKTADVHIKGRVPPVHHVKWDTTIAFLKLKPTNPS